MKEPLEQFSVGSTPQLRKRLRQKIAQLSLKSRSRTVVAAIGFFLDLPDEAIKHWMEKTEADMKREREE